MLQAAYDMPEKRVSHILAADRETSLHLYLFILIEAACLTRLMFYCLVVVYVYFNVKLLLRNVVRVNGEGYKVTLFQAHHA